MRVVQSLNPTDENSKIVRSNFIIRVRTLHPHLCVSFQQLLLLYVVTYRKKNSDQRLRYTVHVQTQEQIMPHYSIIVHIYFIIINCLYIAIFIL